VPINRAVEKPTDRVYTSGAGGQEAGLRKAQFLRGEAELLRLLGLECWT